MSPDPHCREEPARSVYLGGDITDALIDRVAPQILSLKATNLEPITVYINSRGGLTNCTDTLIGLLKAKNAENKRPWIVTAAVGKAKSAAADLLVFGDYAIAYPESQIHFHGIRLSELKEVTVERASAYASIIAEENSKMAMRLAESSIHRFVLRYAMQKSKFDEVRQLRKSPHLSDLECFAWRIFTKMKSETLNDVIQRAYRKCEAIEKMSAWVGQRSNKMKVKGQADYDVRVLKLVLDYELKRRKAGSWSLDPDGLSEVVRDFTILKDFHGDEHNRPLRKMVKRFGRSFLSTQQLEEYEAISGSPEEEREKWLWKKTASQVKMFWYFVVCVWRNLQEEENPISPIEAYWLGAVDEVVGTKLAALRWTIENTPEKPKTETPSN